MSAWRQKLNPEWIVPDWPVPSHVRAVCTTRAGGVSAAPFDSLNLGEHVGDEPSHVDSNRFLVRSATVRTLFLRQIHGNVVLHLESDVASHHEADAAFTHQHNMACAVMVADCLPILLTDAAGTAVAAAHAGWRGLAGLGGDDGKDVIESVLVCFKPLAGAPSTVNAPEVIAWLGPCIGPSAFEVGDDVRDAFNAHAGESALDFFKPATAPGKWWADLAGLARLRLKALGVQQIYGNDSSPGWCTVSNPSKFFSFRRDHATLGGSGRMAASIWLAD